MQPTNQVRPDNMGHSSDMFQVEAGWLVVPAVWMGIVQVGERAYKKLRQEVLINVNYMVRLKGGVKVVWRAKGRGATKLCFIDEGEHNWARCCLFRVISQHVYIKSCLIFSWKCDGV